MTTFFILFSFACEEIKTPKAEPFIGENVPPPKQEFRWSNGKMPKSFDPARASAAPETDIVRALYEGLTDIDPKTLQPIPALATKWSASEDKKIWTFQLRRDAKWTNGENVTAQDFVDSWKRLTELGSNVTQRNIFKNIVGMDSEDVLPVFADETIDETEENFNDFSLKQNTKTTSNSNIAVSATPNPSPEIENQTKIDKKPQIKNKGVTRFGVEAVGEHTLKVTLIYPDEKFPLLVAHPIFHPIYGDGKEFENNKLDKNIVTNGAFRLVTVSDDGITLEKSQIYWHKDEVQLEHVKFIPTENAETALAAYRDGQVDAVTNANFQPLALKLLQPFENEYHETTHGALNYYQFNLQAKPFDDLRVREALAISIEREKITEGDLDGATKPALSFQPFEDNDKKLKQNIEQAKSLLTEAGFSNGENFPTIKLVVNRNNIQLRIANSVAKMWEKYLNLKTEVIAKDSVDYQNSIQTGDYSLARKGIVMPTNNETSNMLAMFDDVKLPSESKEQNINQEDKVSVQNQILTDKTAESKLDFSELDKTPEPKTQEHIAQVNSNDINESGIILTETQALEELPAIPLYFPNSYSLVKPYIEGFDLNAFDIVSLKNVRIDSNWQPETAEIGSNQ